MATPEQIIRPFADSAGAGDISTIPQTDPNGFVNFTEGYTRFYEISLQSGDPQAKAVERPAQNYLFNLITSNLQAWQQFGLPPWYSGMQPLGGYGRNAQVARVGTDGVMRVYRSLKDANISDPQTTPADWEYQQTSGEMRQNIPAPLGGAGGPTAAQITGGIDFNAAPYSKSGTWYFNSDAAAGASSNGPTPTSGGTTRAGLLQTVEWTYITPGQTMAAQWFSDFNGEWFTRGKAGTGAWSPWRAWATAARVQSGAYTFAVDTSAAVNAVTVAFLPSLTRADGTQIIVKIKNTNTGAATIADGVGTVPIVGAAGQALTGGELVADRNVMLMYSAAAAAYAIVSSHGGVQQVTAGSYLFADPPADDYTNKLISSRWVRSNVMPYRTAMTGTPDLNTFVDRGIYLCPTDAVAAGANFPIAAAGFLIVHSPSVTGAAQTTNVTQEYRTLAANRLFRRALLGAVWSAWVEVASTAYVQSRLGNMRATMYVSASQALVAADAGKAIYFSGAAGQTITLPVPNTVTNGDSIHLINLGNTDVTVATSAGTVIALVALSPGGNVSSVVLKTGESIILSQVDANTWVVAGGTITIRLAPPTTTRAGELVLVAANAIPAGAVKANGQALSRTTYAQLFSKIGTLYGAGDGSTTFNVPDFRGMFPRAWDDGRGFDAGRGMGTYQANAMLDHTHGFGMNADGYHAHSMDAVGDHAHTYQTAPPASNPDGQGASSGASWLALDGYATYGTGGAGYHAHGIYANGSHTHYSVVYGVNSGQPMAGEVRVHNIAALMVIFYQ